MEIPDEYKTNFNNSTYIRGYKILEMIAKDIEENGVGKKGVYLDTSKKYYDSINASDKAKLIRLDYDLTLKEQKKRLKKRRIKKYKIEKDELTREELRSGHEFSHIRSCAMYKHISDHIDNGLIVNKETHKLITERGINDEEGLRELCKEQNWNLDWYERYIRKINHYL